MVLDLVSGRFEDAAAHLREGLQTALRTGARARLLDDLDCCGYLCAMTGRCAEAVTVWAAVVLLQGREGFAVPSHPDLPEGWLERQEPLREARRALGPARARAAEERGQAMSLATAAEYAFMLAAAGPRPGDRGWGGGRRGGGRGGSGRGQAQPPGTGAGHPGRPGADRRADRGPSVHQRAHGQLAPGPDPGQDRMPGGAPTSPVWPSAPAWSDAAWFTQPFLPKQPPGRGGVGGFHPRHDPTARGAERPLPRTWLCGRAYD